MQKSSWTFTARVSLTYTYRRGTRIQRARKYKSIRRSHTSCLRSRAPNTLSTERSCSNLLDFQVDSNKCPKQFNWPFKNILLSNIKYLTTALSIYRFHPSKLIIKVLSKFIWDLRRDNNLCDFLVCSFLPSTFVCKLERFAAYIHNFKLEIELVRLADTLCPISSRRLNFILLEFEDRWIIEIRLNAPTVASAWVLFAVDPKDITNLEISELIHTR